ncbi:MAG: hypothetical protein FJX11_14040 [Alphaproteobacteria bacterium]|nr:hypothetical protein [Alphaproteobacteria bacterium]
MRRKRVAVSVVMAGFRMPQSATFWIGLLLLAALGGALLWSDGLIELSRASASAQRRTQALFATALQELRGGDVSAALWLLLSLSFGYGVLHTLGPGHGKAVIAAYFLDEARPFGWWHGALAGGWMAFTHTISAVILAIVLKLLGTVTLFGAVAQVRSVEIASYAAILALGLWRLRSALTGEPHVGHAAGIGCGPACLPPKPRGTLSCEAVAQPRVRGLGTSRNGAGLLLLGAAGVAPCAGALILVLLSMAMDVLWAGLIGVVAIALGMASALAAVGMASALARRLLVDEGGPVGARRWLGILSAAIVVSTGATLLLGSLNRAFGW